MTDRRSHRRELLVALDELAEAAEANAVRNDEIRRRIASIRQELAEGTPVAELVASEPRPLVVELVTTNMATLEEFGSAFRQAEAEALRAEGLTLQEIGSLFGVTRQRISTLLRARR